MKHIIFLKENQDSHNNFIFYINSKKKYVDIIIFLVPSRDNSETINKPLATALVLAGLPQTWKKCGKVENIWIFIKINGFC